jgi:hypothetical protein
MLFGHLPGAVFDPGQEAGVEARLKRGVEQGGLEQ